MLCASDIEDLASGPHEGPMVVGFCGAKAHGKDTAAKLLIEKYDFVPVSFATGLRETVCKALRVEPEYFLDPDNKETIDCRTGKPRRYWLQWIGTEGFRALWEDIWVWWWEQEVLEKGYTRVVATDLRFPNELVRVRNFDSLAIRITNPRKPVNNDAHASELHYKDMAVDYDILNDDTIEHLHHLTEAAVLTRWPSLGYQPAFPYSGEAEEYTSWR